jgi:hypothetical protein
VLINWIPLNVLQIVLDHTGFTPLLDGLMHECMSVIGSRLFPDFGGATLDSHHGKSNVVIYLFI